MTFIGHSSYCRSAGVSEIPRYGNNTAKLMMKILSLLSSHIVLGFKLNCFPKFRLDYIHLRKA